MYESETEPCTFVKAPRARRGRLVALVVAALAFTSSVAASECFAPAPSAALGDPFAALEPSVLDAGQRRTAQRLLSRLAGRWRGTSTGYFCDGKVGAARERRDNHTVEARFDFTSDEILLLRAELESKTAGTTRVEALRVLLRDERLRSDRDDAAGDTRLLELASDRIAYLHKTGLAGSGDFVEISRRFVLTGNTLRIEHRVYSAGGLSAASDWVLKRR